MSNFNSFPTSLCFVKGMSSKMKEVEIKKIFDLNETIAKNIFNKHIYPWEVLPEISNFIIELGKTLDQEKFKKIGDNIWIAKSAEIAPSSSISGPCIIDENAQIRHSAYIRGNVIVGKEAVVRKFDRTKKCDSI